MQFDAISQFGAVSLWYFHNLVRYHIYIKSMCCTCIVFIQHSHMSDLLNLIAFQCIPLICKPLHFTQNIFLLYWSALHYICSLIWLVAWHCITFCCNWFRPLHWQYSNIISAIQYCINLVSRVTRVIPLLQLLPVMCAWNTRFLCLHLVFGCLISSK